MTSSMSWGNLHSAPSHMLELGPPFLSGIGWIPWRPQVLRGVNDCILGRRLLLNPFGIALVLPSTWCVWE